MFAALLRACLTTAYTLTASAESKSVPATPALDRLSSAPSNSTAALPLSASLASAGCRPNSVWLTSCPNRLRSPHALTTPASLTVNSSPASSHRRRPSTGTGVSPYTATLTLASLTAPSLSIARTVTVCNPSLANGQSASYGASLRLAKLSPPAKISTCVTVPSLSVALALTFSVTPTLTPWPAFGEVITTSGPAFGGSTVTLTASELPWPSRSSIASALRVTSPASVALHSSSYGASASSPITWPPARNLTFTTLPSESLALAASCSVFPALSDTPASGWVSATLGGWFADTGRSYLAAITLRIWATSASLNARLYTSTSATAPP